MGNFIAHKKGLINFFRFPPPSPPKSSFLFFQKLCFSSEKSKSGQFSLEITPNVRTNLVLAFKKFFRNSVGPILRKIDFCVENSPFFPPKSGFWPIRHISLKQIAPYRTPLDSSQKCASFEGHLTPLRFFSDFLRFFEFIVKTIFPPNGHFLWTEWVHVAYHSIDLIETRRLILV